MEFFRFKGIHSALKGYLLVSQKDNLKPLWFYLREVQRFEAELLLASNSEQRIVKLSYAYIFEL